MDAGKSKRDRKETGDNGGLRVKLYHVGVKFGMNMDTVLIEYHDEITLNNFEEFKDKAFIEACNQANEDITQYNPKVISWQIIND